MNAPTVTMIQSVDNQTTSQRNLSPNAPVRASTENERFPSFDFTAQPSAGLPAVSESPAEARATEYRWPSRRTSQRLPLTGRAGFQTHRPRRSLSDTFSRLRNRESSVSEGAQDLAEALKAPVSYKLIVCYAHHVRNETLI